MRRGNGLCAPFSMIFFQKVSCRLYLVSTFVVVVVAAVFVVVVFVVVFVVVVFVVSFAAAVFVVSAVVFLAAAAVFFVSTEFAGATTDLSLLGCHPGIFV